MKLIIQFIHVSGPEIAVASTKAYTTQLIVLLLLGMYISQALEMKTKIINVLLKVLLHYLNILKTS